MSCILSQLNILCTSLIKSYYTENNDSPVIQRSHVTVTLRVLERIGFHRSGAMHIITTFSTISGERIVLNSTNVRYTLHKCSETIKYAKNDNSPLKCHLFPVQWSS